VTDNEIRVGRAARSDLRVKLGDPVNVQPETSVKYAKHVKLAVFADSLAKAANGGHAACDYKLVAAKVAPYFAGKFRPLHTGSVFTTAGGVEFKVTFVVFFFIGGW
jgi:hypothetical protein